MTTEATSGALGSNEWLGGPVPAHELLAWLRDDFERGLSSQGCEAAANEIERLRADYDRVLALQQASYEREILAEVEIERERCAKRYEALKSLALMHVSHEYTGDCPDQLDRDRRSNNCPACAICDV